MNRPGESQVRTGYRMFGSLQPTRYDLTFSVFGIPVRVLPTFWLTGVLFGFDLLHRGQNGPLLLLIWVAVVFVSILVHEFGHALTARAFGYPPRILMYHFGGLAMYEPHTRYTTAKAILITLAGPGAGFLLFGLCYVLQTYLPRDPIVAEAIRMLIWVNLFWGLVNLIPVLPLDGGQVCREVCLSISPRQGLKWALIIGMLVGSAVAVGFWRIGLPYAAILFAVLAVQSYMEFQQRRAW